MNKTWTLFDVWQNTPVHIRRLWGINEKVFDPNDWQYVVIDGTYYYCPQSSYHPSHRRQFSKQKKRPLLKPHIIVCPNGKIINILGLFFSNDTNNDAAIFNAMTDVKFLQANIASPKPQKKKQTKNQINNQQSTTSEKHTFD